MYTLSDHPVKYADHPAVCADSPAAWPDHPVIYLECLALCADGPNYSFRACTGRGGSGTNLDNSVLKTGSAAVGTDGPCSCADGVIMRRSAGLPPMCAGGCGCTGHVSISIP
jgi:hypothetical protein